MGPADTLHVAGLPVDAGPQNLVLRAIAATRRAVGGGWPGGPGPTPGVAARLDKRIPVAAGLGGGSSDAAGGPRRCRGGLWGAELDEHARLAVAAGLGSDVPFFAADGPALVEGRGERVTPLGGLRGAPGILLVTAAVPVSTPDVFATFAAIRGMGDGSVRASSVHLASELGGGLSAVDLAARAGVMAAANDLLPAVAARPAGTRPVPPGPDAAAPPADRTVRLGPDALGDLSFPHRRCCRRGDRVVGRGRTDHSMPPVTDRPS